MTQTITLEVFGLDCPNESAILERILADQKGILALNFDYINAQMFVEYDPDLIQPDEILACARTSSMRVQFAKEKVEVEMGWKKHLRLFLTAGSGICLIIGFVLHLALEGGAKGVFSTAGGPSVPHVAIVFYILAIVLGGYFVLPKAWVALKIKRPDMHLLMVIAVIGAVLIGQWAEAGTVTFLFSVALFLEHWSVSRAKNAIGSLLELAPQMADVIEEGGVVTRQVEEVEIKAHISVKPGDKIPLDGIVIKGSTSVNQATITGESMPIDKSEGSTVYAGTLNHDGSIEVEVTKKAEETTLSKMIELVKQAGQKRAKAQNFVEKFAKIYTPVMMCLSALVMILPYFIWGGSFEDWIYRGLVVLVIACPCALVISTPVTIVSGLTAAAKQGVLIKGGLHLETAGRLKALAFDKTGTLTHGKPKVMQVIPINDHTDQQLLSVAAGLESSSSHPLAKAILAKAQEMGVEIKRCDEMRVIQGKGAEGKINGKPYWLGSHRFLHEKKLETPAIHKQAMELEDAGHSVIVVGTDDHVCGLISVADAPREGIDLILKDLKRAGLRQVVMLTGDNQPTAAALAKEVGIDRYLAELLPEDKVKMMQQLVMRWGISGMVGDGVNDAPAMASSSLGIAMGAAGSDAAIESADIALMADDLSKLPWLIRHAKKALKTIKLNIAFALGLKALFLILAVFGYATLWMAIAADTGASLLVVTNGLRLLKK